MFDFVAPGTSRWRGHLRGGLRDVMRMSRYPSGILHLPPNDISMKHCMRVLLSAAAFVAVHAQAADDCSFVKKVELPSRQQSAVVSSGALEPCSTGSYAVRVYSTAHAAPGFDTDDYVTGVLHARDGTVADAFTADLGARAPQALVVTTRSAGSGGYVGAQAYVTTPRAVRLVASVDGLAPDADVTAALRRAIGKRRAAR